MRVLPSATSTSPAITPPAQRRMRSPRARHATSPTHLMGKSSRHISDSDVSDDLSPEDFSLRVIELENALCNQDKLLCKIFHGNKKLNLELESVFF
jgi:hypothetical protein